MKEKVWCSFGDSITYQEMWQPDVLKAFPMHHINCGLGSTTVGVSLAREITRPAFCADERMGLGAYADIREAETADAIRYQLLLPQKPDVVTIMGGSNDVFYAQRLGSMQDTASDRDSFVGAYKYIVETLLSHSPAVKIFLLSAPWSTPLPNKDMVFTFEECAEAVKQIADFYGLAYIDIFHESGISEETVKQLCQEDGVHPNKEGGKKIAEVVVRAFEAQL